jgi:ABC-type Zn uptake system ZnuABC Zn-binding protein ZnuA
MSCNTSVENESSTFRNTGLLSEIEPDMKPKVMALTPIIADWVNQITGDQMVIDSIIPRDIDSHSYQPGAKDIVRITESDLVFLVGLGYEDRWLSELLANHTDIKIILLGELISPLKARYLEDDYDPHFWFDITRVNLAVNVIAAELSLLDPGSEVYYKRRASAYLTELEILDNSISDLIAEVPDDRRVFMTSHESLGYLNSRYSIEAMESVIPNVSTQTGLNPEHLVDAVKFIKKNDVKVIFLENTNADKVVKTVADETGIRIVTGLMVETLTDDGQTYIDFMNKNINIIVSNLIGGS